jgi:hypothetical protein
MNENQWTRRDAIVTTVIFVLALVFVGVLTYSHFRELAQIAAENPMFIGYTLLLGIAGISAVSSAWMMSVAPQSAADKTLSEAVAINRDYRP